MSTIQAGSLTLNSPGPPNTAGGSNNTGFQPVTFPTPFPAGSKVIVIPMVQTFKGPDTPGVRIQDVNLNGFRIRMNEIVVHNPNVQALSDGSHVNETIGWVAFSV